MFASSRGIRVWWDQKGEGTPVLLIMGHTYASDMWYPVIPDIAKHHHVVWFDNRGTGMSASTYRASMTDLVADALAVMDTAGLESAHIYGVSMGGFIALQLAMEHPDRVRSLSLGCTAMNIDRLPRHKIPPWLVYRLPNWMIRGGLHKSYPKQCSAEAVAHDVEVFLSKPRSPRGLMAQYQAILGYGYDAQELESIKAPALVMHGKRDKNVPYACGQELADALLNSRLVSYEHAAHNYLMTDAEDANHQVLKHIASVDGSITP